MDYFRSGFKSVMGNPSQESSETSYADTIEKLFERIMSSSLLEDRRDACRALKALSKKYRVEVGAQGLNLNSFVKVLQMDASDNEIVSMVLDTLCNVTSPVLLEEEEKPACEVKSWGSVGEQFTEMFIKNPDNVVLILRFLDEYDFRVRWPAVKLFSNLVLNKPKEVQDIVLVSPMGVSKLMDLLIDNREIIRNDALLLLIELTKNNANIQKIVAFENAFDRLFEVIADEGYAEGDIIVEDCLLLMLNLLKNNASNQNFFKEGSYIQRLKPIIDLPKEDDPDISHWLPQKVSNIFCVLRVIRALVAPTNPTQVTVACQKAMHTGGILQALCSILLANGVPVNILTESINATAEIIRGNCENQEYFSTIKIPCVPPREALIILLMSMVNEKQPISLRCSVLYCFQCFLFKNELGQSKLIQTLLPSTIEQESVTTGQLLCAGLFSHDSLSNWFSAVALAHSMIDNPVQRELMLKVMLKQSGDAFPSSLLHLVADNLQNSCKVQSKLGALMLLCSWLSHCPQAVAQFLEIPNAIPYLIIQTSALEYDENEMLVRGLCAFLMGICLIFNDGTSNVFTKDNLRHLITKRVSLEAFLAKLNDVSRHEMYALASKQPQLNCKTAKDVILDYEFCKLFKILEGVIIKTVKPDNGDGAIVTASCTDNSEQYKLQIKLQDKKLNELEAETKFLREQLESSVKEVEQLRKMMTELREENQNYALQEIALKSDLAEQAAKHENMRSKEYLNEGIIEDLKVQLNAARLETGELKELNVQLKKDHEDLLVLWADQEARMEEYKANLMRLGYSLSEENCNNVAPSNNYYENIPDV